MKLKVIDYLETVREDGTYNWVIVTEEETGHIITVGYEPQEEEIITALIKVGYLDDEKTVGDFGIEWITDGIYDIYLSENYKPVCRLEMEDDTY